MAFVAETLSGETSSGTTDDDGTIPRTATVSGEVTKVIWDVDDMARMEQADDGGAQDHSSARIMPTTSSATANETPRSCSHSHVDVRQFLSFDAMCKTQPLNCSPPKATPFRLPPKKDPKSTASDPFAQLETLPGEPVYADQCAIKMSIALQDGGLSLATYPKARSEVRRVEQLGRSIRGALAAEELANWLIKALGKPKTYPGSTAHSSVKGKKGIVFFKDFWQRPQERSAQGDHIDLWNGSTTPSLQESFWTTDNDYFRRSSEVWFWEIAP